jgi:2-C-methyl-D-erythritol 4-phosphate cytidylyltransferase
MPVRTFMIAPAAGAGARFGAAAPKQYADLDGQPVLWHTLERLAMLDAAATIVALAPDDDRFDALIGARAGVVALRCGGTTRGSTVQAALQAIASRCGDDDWIVVHDAARPCVPRECLAGLVQDLAGDAVGGLLALPLADTLKRAGPGGDALRVARTEARDGLWLAQTPQMFRYRWLAAAHALESVGRCTDEAQAIEALAATGVCEMPKLVRGSAANVKITYASDLALAAAILGMQRTRTSGAN